MGTSNRKEEYIRLTQIMPERDFACGRSRHDSALERRDILLSSLLMF